MVFDPFAYLGKEETEEVIQIDEEMFTTEIGGKILGIDEGLAIGIIIGFFAANIIG